MLNTKAELDTDKQINSDFKESANFSSPDRACQLPAYSNIAILFSGADNDCTKEVIRELITELSSQSSPASFVPAPPSTRGIASIRRSIDRLLGSDKK